MKSIDGSYFKKLIFFIMVFGILLYCGYNYYYNYIYESINVTLKSNVIEYGSEKVDIKSLIKSVEGEIVSKNNKFDTAIIGKQEIVLTVKKAIVEKEIPIVISVIDATAPVINLKNDVVKITKGDNFNLNDNVLSVVDEIDGDLEYSNNNEDSNLKKYNIVCSDDVSNVGTHVVVIEATDGFGNVATADYTLMVEETAFQRATRINYNLSANRYSDMLVSVAYSLLGKPYGHGNGPDLFDCSGLVQYVYSTVGVGISRSSYTQLYDGLAISRNDMMPGDIICWGNGSNVSHTAIYVGNDQMIHAANPSQGVILSSVSGWDMGSSTDIVSIRRI